MLSLKQYALVNEDYDEPGVHVSITGFTSINSSFNSRSGTIKFHRFSDENENNVHLEIVSTGDGRSDSKSVRPVHCYGGDLFNQILFDIHFLM